MEGYSSLSKRFKKEYKIYIVAFLILLIADSIGSFAIPLGPGMVYIFPIFYGIIIGLILGPDLIGFFKKEEVKAASPLVLVAIAPFIVKLGILGGGNIPKLLEVGPALLLQELGNIATVFIALPLALFLGLKREAVGAAHSIDRETNLALISNLYGPSSPEMRGTLSVYIIGGLIGTIYMGFLATLVASTGLFHPYALGMASGVGSGIMMASATASLAHMYPSFAEEILMLGGASDMLTGLTGIYAALFIALPLANKLYSVLEPKIGRGRKSKTDMSSNEEREIG
ncbi:DUF3100 domain-containing protein [Metabacillus halosaccharovorans]|uniref:DUF3100 domain-containing protein n=1 Tax=Metabacillus halosaccharovorans TaxID=930124 RepID=UPI00204230BD|nr:DUF3100 domain-containing protein [Metabacillus halosaccharovorans]MCM3439328.1 DUF3100 domain-containing protein [Metabacillus halosaccharovorans]